MDWIKRAYQTLAFFAGFVPQIIAFIQAVELPDASTGKGPEKRELLFKLVIAAMEALPDEVEKMIGIDKVIKFVDKVTDDIVAFLNKIGIFKKTP